MRTQAATHAGAKVPLRSPRALYREHFADARRERLFLSSVAFFLTFAIVRAITYTTHAGRGPFHDVVVRGMHLHHLVLGILLLLGVGYLWLAQVGTGIGRSPDWPSRLRALLYGVAAALALDEFALCLRLEDVNWARERRESIDAVIISGALLGVGTWGRRFFHALAREAARALRL